MVEKPAKGTSPSNLAISGRYILKPEIFDILATQERGSGGEIQLTDAMITLAKSQDFYAHLFDGDIYDTGMKIGFLTANLALGLAHPELGAPLRAAIKRMGL
jgi:UTP--glucose-1-phosphate uridylyltransferase